VDVGVPIREKESGSGIYRTIDDDPKCTLIVYRIKPWILSLATLDKSNL